MVQSGSSSGDEWKCRDFQLQLAGWLATAVMLGWPLSQCITSVADATSSRTAFWGAGRCVSLRPGFHRAGAVGHRRKRLPVPISGVLVGRHGSAHGNSDTTRADSACVCDSRWRFRDALPDHVEVGWGTYLSPMVVETLSAAGS